MNQKVVMQDVCPQAFFCIRNRSVSCFYHHGVWYKTGEGGGGCGMYCIVSYIPSWYSIVLLRPS